MQTCQTPKVGALDGRRRAARHRPAEARLDARWRRPPGRRSRTPAGRCGWRATLAEPGQREVNGLGALGVADEHELLLRAGCRRRVDRLDQRGRAGPGPAPASRRSDDRRMEAAAGLPVRWRAVRVPSVGVCSTTRFCWTVRPRPLLDVLVGEPLHGRTEGRAAARAAARCRRGRPRARRRRRTCAPRAAVARGSLGVGPDRRRGHCEEGRRQRQGQQRCRCDPPEVSTCPEGHISCLINA